MLSGFGLEGFANDEKKNASMMVPGLGMVPGANPKGGVPSASLMPSVKPISTGQPHALPGSGAKATFVGSTHEGMADFGSDSMMGPVPMAAGQKPQGCYPREQLNPMDLLPEDSNSQWAQVNPTGAGDIQGKNFLSAGALIGINTIGQSLRNANLQLRAEPPCPQSAVSPWNISTIEPDFGRVPLELGAGRQ
jgi:hypothetical protein